MRANPFSLASYAPSRLSLALHLTLFTHATMFFSGCSSVQGVGDSVLRGMATVPSAQVVDTRDSVHEMAELQDVSQESEYYLGRAVAAKVLSLYPVVNDEVLTQYINKVGQVVVAFSDRPETYGGYRFGILDTEELNALAAPGGFIFISKGLLNVLPDEDALAAVLAHEVSHVSERHALKRVSGKELSSALDAAGVVAGALTCNQAIQSASKVLGVVTDKITSILLEKGYSREQEYEADAGSVRILQRAGYEGSGLVTVLNQLDRGAVNQSAGWFKTHPSNESRRIAVKHILPPGAGERSSQAQVQRTRRFLRSVRGQIE